MSNMKFCIKSTNTQQSETIRRYTNKSASTSLGIYMCARHLCTVQHLWSDLLQTSFETTWGFLYGSTLTIFSCSRRMLTNTNDISIT